ncbi:MAG: T9SS type A sorting domain-containing protein, partial [bacterium]
YTRGGAIALYNTLATASNNYFKQNSAQGGSALGGAIRIYKTAFILENNIIKQNTASYGGAIEIYDIPLIGSEKSIINNTIVNNSASIAGGAISVGNGFELILINSILWGNSSNQIATFSGGTVQARYNDIEGGYSGIGNLSVDPFFVSGDSLMNLSDASPCIGTGIDSTLGYLVPPYDYDGDNRPMPAGSMPDIGSQENPLGPSRIEFVDGSMPQEFTLKQNYPNPFNPSTTIQFDLPKTSEVTLRVYNILGEEVATLVSEKLSTGSYSYEWDASKLASGVYLYRMQAGDPSQGAGQSYVETRKMALVR